MQNKLDRQLSVTDVCRHVRAQHWPLGLLILTAYDDEPYVLAVCLVGYGITGGGTLSERASCLQMGTIEVMRLAIHQGRPGRVYRSFSNSWYNVPSTALAYSRSMANVWCSNMEENIPPLV